MNYIQFVVSGHLKDTTVARTLFQSGYCRDGLYKKLKK